MTKYDIKYIKRNLDLKTLFRIFTNQKKNNEEGDIHYCLQLSCATNKNLEIKKNVEGYQYKYSRDMYILEKFNSYKYPNKDYLKDKIEEYEFKGTFLPKVSSNFELSFHFEMYANDDFSANISHSLVKSKMNKTFYYIWSLREYDSKEKRFKIVYNCLLQIIKKNIKTKRDFFEIIIKRNKFDKVHHLKRMYNSKNGINYLDLYNKGKL